MVGVGRSNLLPLGLVEVERDRAVARVDVKSELAVEGVERLVLSGELDDGGLGVEVLGRHGGLGVKPVVSREAE